MKLIIFILILGFYACSSVTKKTIESKLTDTVIPGLTLKQIDTLPAISVTEKKKEFYKSTLATFWERSSRKFPFDGWLSEIKDNDSILQLKFQIDSIKKNSSSANNDSIQFNLSNRWILKLYLTEGWYGFSSDPNENKKNNYYISKKNKSILTGSDIFEIFKLSEKTFPLNHFPLIFTRNAKFNSEWTAILIENNILIIRLVSSYPDGNQTSWQYEKLYLFTRFIK